MEEALAKLIHRAEEELKRAHKLIWMRHADKAQALASRVGEWLHAHHAARYIEMMGYEQAQELLSVDEKQVMKTIRVNTLKASVEEVKRRLEAKGFQLERHPYVEYGLVIKHSPYKPGATIEYIQGLYTIQGPASMLAVPAMGLEELKTDHQLLIADQCAGAGIKTTQLAQHRPDAAIAAIDINRRKLLALRNNLQRLAVTNVAAYNMDGRNLPRLSAFNAVLLDAPCTGEGLIPFPKGKWPRSFEDVRNRVRLQLELAYAAAKALESGGRLLYSTCSMSVEENEYVLTKLLEVFEDLNPIEPRIHAGTPGITEYAGLQLDKRLKQSCRRLYPHIHRTEGFTICLLEKA